MFLVYDQESLIGLYMQDYTSLCAAVMICTTLVDIQTQETALWSAYMKFWARWAKNYWYEYGTILLDLVCVLKERKLIVCYRLQECFVNSEAGKYSRSVGCFPPCTGLGHAARFVHWTIEYTKMSHLSKLKKHQTQNITDKW